MTSRLGTHLLRRLRHRLEAEALDRAVGADVLIAGAWDVDGAQIRGFTAHPTMLQKTPRQIQRLMARLGSGDGSSRSRAATSMNFEDNVYVIDEDAAPPSNMDASQKKRRDPKASAPRRSSNAHYRRLTATLLRAVRGSADRPQAADIATLLLLARAVSDSGIPLTEVLRVLRTPRPIITMVAPVAGFEGALIDLLARGFVLPGKVAIASGYELSSAPARFSLHHSERWRAIIFPGIKFDPDELEDIDKRVGRAALLPHPILGVAESDERLPERLKSAAQLTLSTGPLDMALLKEVIAVVLDEEPEKRLPDEACALLSLSDLAISIRPGVTAKQVIGVLEQIAGMKPVDPEAGSGKPGSKDSRGETTSWKRTSKSGRGDPGSGSEVIQPVALTGGDRDRPVARVETLAGYGQACEWALSLKSDLDLWRTGDLGWEEMSTKLLLSGPPGTGKTTFARALCNSLQVPLVVSSVSTWLEPGYLGDVLKRMSAAFAEAESLQPAILFIDELDGIGTRRQRGDWVDYSNAIINRGLELLDGASRSSGVIVVAATNHPTMIDPALLRSGRLERHIEIPRPDTAALVGILKHHLKSDLDAVVASAPSEITDAAASGHANALLPDTAAENGKCEPASADDPKETAADGATDIPPHATDGASDPATAPITRTEALESAFQSAGDASHGNV